MTHREEGTCRDSRARSSSSWCWLSSSSGWSPRPRWWCPSRTPSSSSGWAASRGVLDAGFHILVPFVDAIRYRHTLKEQAMDIPEQVCITRDNVQVAVDGILYLKVLDPRAGLLRHHQLPSSPSPSSPRPRCAARSARSSSTRPSRSGPTSTSRWSPRWTRPREAWGVKVLRYEIKNITPPAGHHRRHGEADARGAREARRHPAVRGRARRRHQHRRGPEAAGHQGLRGQEAAADQRGRGPGLGHPGGRQGHRRRHPRRWPSRSRAGAATRRCSCGWPSSTSPSSATSPRRATPWWCPPTWATWPR